MLNKIKALELPASVGSFHFAENGDITHHSSVQTVKVGKFGDAIEYYFPWTAAHLEKVFE